MHLNNYQNMDVNLLLSIVNMKLRNSQIDLDELCCEYDINKDVLVARLAEINVLYHKKHNQFSFHTYAFA
ncbi:hypothetical protein DS2_14144 [Catenovulum agarivorans DS-2]|uniref:DUF4250 domain-containing protein n=1 Tax=Catenovulum agarivorans DS-2 TaxID=1328313 RepID=W7QAY6_9ALTE|nr:DUF4250 domain-containing protein [Catenovulum agarivorans]EWH09121.1 hypothetical protein DS2_14144 [Catenovulum agarivorans DS-2]